MGINENDKIVSLEDFHLVDEMIDGIDLRMQKLRRSAIDKQSKEFRENRQKMVYILSKATPIIRVTDPEEMDFIERYRCLPDDKKTMIRGLVAKYS